MTLDEKRKLYSSACAVVCHLANTIATAHLKFGSVLRDALDERVIDEFLGQADCYMQTLGDLMNAHDLNADSANEWIDPIYERMQQWKETVSA
jgi:hypothetical protein